MAPDVHMATPLKIFETREPSRFGPRHNSEDLLEERLVARDRQRALVREPVLLLGLHEELLEDGVVQVRRAHDESLATGAHTNRHVTGGNIGRSAGGCDA